MRRRAAVMPSMMILSDGNTPPPPIWPAIAAGSWVLSDRFADSTLADQGYGKGLEIAWLESLYGVVAGDFGSRSGDRTTDRLADPTGSAGDQGHPLR